MQFVLATATLTAAVRRLLEEGDLPPCRLLETSDLGQVVSSSSHSFVSAAGLDKLDLLLEVVRGQAARAASRAKAQAKAQAKGGITTSPATSATGGPSATMVFCNTVASCRAAEHRLRDAGLSCGAYHGEMNSAARVEALDRFKRGNTAVLVCTDLAQRGLDLPGVDEASGLVA